MPEEKRTPGPWIASPETDQYDLGIAEIFSIRWTVKVRPNPTGERWAAPSIEESRANAQFIVRACNAHDALVKALEEAKRWMPGWGSGTPATRGAVCETAYDAHAMVQAALKLAKEGE